MQDEIRVGTPRARVTLDGQLLSYWEREALRLDGLAGKARWNWVARRLRRKAERARETGAVFAAREGARRSPMPEGDPA